MQPREKLLSFWAQNLWWSELVATILWSGVQWADVFQLAKKVNKVIEEKRELLQIDDLLNIHGIWKVKAIQLVSAFELAKRYFVQDSIQITSIWDVLTQVREYRNKKQEYLLCLTLDGASRLIEKRVVTIGLLNQSLVHPREVFSDAISDRANSIILVHNHPSGTCEPSMADRQVTQRLVEVSKLVGIEIQDHIIITKESYFSLKENNML